MPKIRIELNTRINPRTGKRVPEWKYAEASLIFTDEDGPLMSGLVLSGFTIGKSMFEDEDPTALNVTLPNRSYEVGGEKKTWNYVRPVSMEHKPVLNNLLRQIADAYRDVVALIPPDPEP